MKNIRILIIVVIIAAALAACNTDQPSQNKPQVDDVTLALGKTVFQANCSACHSTKDDTILVGPSLPGLVDRAGKIVPGLNAREYIEQSILDPGAYLNEGFTNVMPDTYASILNEDEFDAVVEYLLTFE